MKTLIRLAAFLATLALLALALEAGAAGFELVLDVTDSTAAWEISTETYTNQGTAALTVFELNVTGNVSADTLKLYIYYWNPRTDGYTIWYGDNTGITAETDISIAFQEKGPGDDHNNLDSINTIDLYWVMPLPPKYKVYVLHTGGNPVTYTVWRWWK